MSSQGAQQKRQTTLRNKEISVSPLSNLKLYDGGQATQSSPHYLNLNKEQSIGVLPKPHVKIIDLQHNLLPLDSGIHSSQLSIGVGIASNTGQQIVSDGGVRIDA